MFEVEFRSRFNLKKFNTLKKFLDKNAENLGQDNKDCYFYIFSEKLLKLVNNISKKTAKISLKLNRIGKGSLFPERELYFNPKDFKNACSLFDAFLSPDKKMHDFQERINYRYKNCEIALKYSKIWGYHMEIEQMIDKKLKHKIAEDHIRQIANELGVNLMSEKELKKFIEKAESKSK
jgi:adenylate cyclase class IV